MYQVTRSPKSPRHELSREELTKDVLEEVFSRAIATVSDLRECKTSAVYVNGLTFRVCALDVFDNDMGGVAHSKLFA